MNLVVTHYPENNPDATVKAEQKYLVKTIRDGLKGRALKVFKNPELVPQDLQDTIAVVEFPVLSRDSFRNVIRLSQYMRRIMALSRHNRVTYIVITNNPEITRYLGLEGLTFTATGLRLLWPEIIREICKIK